MLISGLEPATEQVIETITIYTYSEETWFDSRQGHRLFWMLILRVSPLSLGEYRDISFK